MFLKVTLPSGWGLQSQKSVVIDISPEAQGADFEPEPAPVPGLSVQVEQQCHMSGHWIVVSRCCVTRETEEALSMHLKKT
jgi:hypothetical protein